MDRKRQSQSLFAPDAYREGIERFDDGGNDAVLVYGRGVFDAPLSLSTPLQALVFPLGSTSLRAVIDGQSFDVDHRSVLKLPAGAACSINEGSMATEFLAMALRPRLATVVKELYDFSAKELREAWVKPTLIVRTTWINELGYRYLFERKVCRKSANTATTFLETEIYKEVCFAAKAARITGIPQEHTLRLSKIVAKAVRILEGAMGEMVPIATLAKAVGASESTLLRACKRELGVTPSDYIKAFRLDIAKTMLTSSQVPIGEIARRVGYDSLSAFTRAFKGRFGMSPSDARTDRDRKSRP